MVGFLNHIIDLFFPNLCLVCDEGLVSGEEQLCLSCFNKIHKTNYHLAKDNPVEKRFWGKVRLERASSYFFFQKGSDFQKLIHELKYRGNKEIGIVLGKYAALDLLQSEDFNSIDVIIPVPLHRKKLAKRGYNQSDQIGIGISKIMEKPLTTHNLVRKLESATQTKKSVFERFENTQGIFELKNPDELAGKHILLVDDVLTTGSTLEACVHALKEAEDVKVSVFTLAVAT